MFKKFYYHLSSFALTFSLLSTLASANQPSLMDLPEELLVEVAAKLSPPDAARFARTSHACNAAVTDARDQVASTNLLMGASDPVLSRLLPDATLIPYAPSVRSQTFKFSTSGAPTHLMPFLFSNLNLDPVLSCIHPSSRPGKVRERLQLSKPILVSTRAAVYDLFKDEAPKQDVLELYLSSLLPTDNLDKSDDEGEDEHSDVTADVSAFSVVKARAHAVRAGFDHRFGEYKLFVHASMVDQLRDQFQANMGFLQQEIDRDYVAFSEAKIRPKAKYVVVREHDLDECFEKLNIYFFTRSDQTLLIDSQSKEFGVSSLSSSNDAKSMVHFAFSDSQHITTALSDNFTISSLLIYGNRSVDLSALRDVTVIGKNFLLGLVSIDIDISGFTQVHEIKPGAFSYFKDVKSIDFSSFRNVRTLTDRVLFYSNSRLDVIDPYDIYNRAAATDVTSALFN